MDWFLQHWQNIAAFAIVAITVSLFAIKLTRPRSKPGCGGGCDCGKPQPVTEKNEREQTAAGPRN